MKIKKLKKKHPLIYKAAMDNLEEGKNEGSYLHDDFNWNLTKEDYHFWDNVDDKNFKEAYKICPVLKPKKSKEEVKKYTLEVIETEEHVTIKQNGEVSVHILVGVLSSLTKSGITKIQSES